VGSPAAEGRACIRTFTVLYEYQSDQADRHEDLYYQ
jgi:hypothetical protein